MNIVLPTKKRGRPKDGEREQYIADLKIMATQILEMQSHYSHRQSSRGWCYLLENQRVINKDQFDMVQGCINEARKLGILPIDFVLDEDARSFDNTEDSISYDYENPEDSVVRQVREALDDYITYGGNINFWDAQTVYVQMLVEKVDLKVLFGGICAHYHIPIATAHGWSSIMQRNEMAQRFKYWQNRSKDVVLLYCGDHDPAGLKISEVLMSNFKEIEGGSGWCPDDLIIDRFGLNYDLIQRANLTWIDNLISGRKKPPEYHKQYVRDYIAKYGERKVEANALVTREDLAKELVENAINQYLPTDANEASNREQARGQRRIEDLLNKSDAHTIFSEIDDTLEDLASDIEKIIEDGG